MSWCEKIQGGVGDKNRTMSIWECVLASATYARMHHTRTHRHSYWRRAHWESVGSCPLTQRGWRWCSRRGTRGCRHRCGWRTPGSRGSCCAPSPACTCREDPGRRRRRRSASPCRWSSSWGSSPRSGPRGWGPGTPRSGWPSLAWSSRPGTGRDSTGRPWCRLGACTGQDTLRAKWSWVGEVLSWHCFKPRWTLGGGQPPAASICLNLT